MRDVQNELGSTGRRPFQDVDVVQERLGEAESVGVLTPKAEAEREDAV